MGFQIPGPTKGKVQYLVDVYQAVVLARPPRNFNDIPDHQAIICVVDTRLIPLSQVHQHIGVASEI